MLVQPNREGLSYPYRFSRLLESEFWVGSSIIFRFLRIQFWILAWSTVGLAAVETRYSSVSIASISYSGVGWRGDARVARSHPANFGMLSRPGSPKVDERRREREARSESRFTFWAAAVQL